MHYNGDITSRLILATFDQHPIYSQRSNDSICSHIDISSRSIFSRSSRRCERYTRRQRADDYPISRIIWIRYVDSNEEKGLIMLQPNDYSRKAMKVMKHLLPTQPHHHRDHIVPVSFCRKLGISPYQCSRIENLQYLRRQENLDKWSFINDGNKPHLRQMCILWGIEYPSEETINEHNKIAALTFTNLNNGGMK